MYGFQTVGLIFFLALVYIYLVLFLPGIGVEWSGVMWGVY